MSIYCTLPRRHPFSGINRSRSTVSAEEARKLVDDLFNPIVAYDCDDPNDRNEPNVANPVQRQNQIGFNRVNSHEKSVYGIYGTNYSDPNHYKDSNPMENIFRNNTRVEKNYENYSSESSQSSVVVPTRVTNRHTTQISNINNNCETGSECSSKLYYAFDNFDDFRRRRRSLAPDFYGGGLTPSLYKTDSAYESSSPSYESLKSESDSQKFKKKSKYFTLPTRRSTGKNRLKDNIHEIANNFSNNKNITNGLVDKNDNKNNYSNALSLQMPNKVNANQTSNGKCVPKNTVNHQEFHCCCRSGCHLNNSIHPNRNNGPNSVGLGLHCCQKMLETLWEEPSVEASALVRNRRPISYSSTNPCNGSNKKIEVLFPYNVYFFPIFFSSTEYSFD